MGKREELLLAAEKRVRMGGYDNFSFRDLAADVGIKSASVHYHFPTKAALGAELVKTYTQRFFDTLGEPTQLNGEFDDPITAYINMFKSALLVDQQMCMCGLLGAETDGLPNEVKQQTKHFFETNIKWLEKAFAMTSSGSKKSNTKQAIRLLCALEGALLVSKSLQDSSVFNAVAKPFLNKQP